MALSLLKKLKKSIKYWWIPTIIGIVFICTGIYGLINPSVSYITLSVIFSISFLFSGISEIIFAVSNREEMDNWGWILAYGIFTTIVGFILINNPLLSLEIFSFYIGFLILFRAISGISVAFEIKEYGIDNWWISLVFSTLLLIFAIIALWTPGLAGLTAVYWFGFGMIIAGLISIYYSFQLKAIKNLPHKISDDLKDRYENLRREMNEHINHNK